MKTRSLVLISVLTCLWLPGLAAAACLQDAALHAAASSGFDSDRSELIACKAVPDSPGKSAVAFINELGRHQHTLTVLVIRNDTRETLHSFVDKNPSIGGIGDPTGIEIDTAKYVIASGKRAFGVRVKTSLNPWDETENLSLLVQSDKRLVRVLEDLTVGFSTRRGCPFEASEIKRTISVANTRSAGFNDLIIRTSQVHYEPVGSGTSECTRSENRSSRMSKLKFTNGAYEYPPGFH